MTVRRVKSYTVPETKERVRAMEDVGLTVCDANGGYIPHRGAYSIYIDLSATNLTSKSDIIRTIANKLLAVGRKEGANELRDNLKELLKPEESY